AGVTPTGLAHEPGGILPGLRRRPWRLLSIPSMVRAIHREAVRLAPHADVIHGHWAYPGGWVAVRAAESTGVRSVVTCHGADMNVLARLPGLRGVLRSTLSRASWTLAVSRTMQSAALKAGADPARTSILPLGVVIHSV